MDRRTCTKCKNVYPATLEYFHKSTGCRYGVSSICKTCSNSGRKERYLANRDREIAYRKKYYQDNQEECKRRNNRWRAENYDQAMAANKRWKEANKEKHSAMKLRWRNNKPHRRLAHSISGNIHKALIRGKDGLGWEGLVGYTLHDLVVHLQDGFQAGMTWENYGEWHIDHIRPISSFTYQSYDDIEFLECWSLENLRPEWGGANISKYNKWEDSTGIARRGTERIIA